MTVTLRMNCPKCANVLDLDIEASSMCHLYHAHTIPLWIAILIDGWKVICGKCGYTWVFSLPAHVTPILVRDESADDE